MISDIIALFEFFLHIDQHLITLINVAGVWVYFILFAIIFLDTGIVFTPFLPGDSLLFAAGAISAIGSLHVLWLMFLLAGAAILGDTVNYWIGNLSGEKILRKKNQRLIRKEYLDRTVAFYEKHGGKAIILARFIPIIRTFAPFVAGIARMQYTKFLFYNITGGIIWVWLFVIAGYLFGNIPLVRENFSLVVLLIIAASLIPVIIKVFHKKFSKP